MALDLPRIEALCFDVDGTLSDTDDRWVQRLGNLLLPLRWALPQRDAYAAARFWIMAAETPGNLLYHWADRLDLDDRIGHFLHRAGRSERRAQTRHWIIPGVRECLEHLAPHFPMAVVSAGGERSTRTFLAQFGLEQYFTAVATGRTCRYTKPFPDPVLWAAEQMGVPPERCLMIGDTTVDIKAGRRAGAQTVGVLCGFGYERELRRAGADEILPSSAHLPYLLSVRDENSNRKEHQVPQRTHKNQ